MKLSISLSPEAMALIEYEATRHNTSSISRTIDNMIQEWASDRGYLVKTTIEVVLKENSGSN